jgi:hypothetical protein
VAVGAIAAGTVFRWVLTEQHLCEGKGERQLAGTPRPAEHDGMRQLVLEKESREMLLHLFLSYDVAPIYHLIIYHLPFNGLPIAFCLQRYKIILNS